MWFRLGKTADFEQKHQKHVVNLGLVWVWPWPVRLLPDRQMEKATSKKHNYSEEFSRWPFTPAYRGKGKIMESDKHELLIVCVHLRRPKHTFHPACRGKSLAVRLRWTFLPACRGKGLLMDLPPCLSMKNTYHGVGVRLRWAFPPACRGKGRLVDLVCACDGLSPWEQCVTS